MLTVDFQWADLLNFLSRDKKIITVFCLIWSAEYWRNDHTLNILASEQNALTSENWNAKLDTNLSESIQLITWIPFTLIVVRSFSLVPSINAWQSSFLTSLKTSLVALSITISIPLNVSWNVRLSFANSSLSKMSQWRTEIPADIGVIVSDLVWMPSIVFPSNRITWQLCFVDSCSASSFDRLVCPFVIYQLYNFTINFWNNLIYIWMQEFINSTWKLMSDNFCHVFCCYVILPMLLNHLMTFAWSIAWCKCKRWRWIERKLYPIAQSWLNWPIDDYHQMTCWFYTASRDSLDFCYYIGKWPKCLH